MQRQQARARMSNVVSVLLASRLWLDGYRLNEVMAIDKPFLPCSWLLAYGGLCS